MKWQQDVLTGKTLEAKLQMTCADTIPLYFSSKTARVYYILHSDSKRDKQQKDWMCVNTYTTAE